MIDLHIHSKFSDGEDSIDEILEIVKGKNIPSIALTDHDTTYGIQEITEKASQINIKIIPAVEISGVSNGHIIHILGYNIDINNSQLQELLNINCSYFNASFLEHYNYLYKHDYVDFDVDKIVEFSKFKQCLSLPDILKAMIACGEPYSLKDWPEFFNEKVKHYNGHFVENFPTHPSTAVEVINNAGGIASFAHPARIGDCDIKEMELLLPHGLKALEVYYPYHGSSLVKKYEEFAHKNGLIKTGGTDWHGKNLTTWNVEIGDYCVKGIEYFFNF